MISTMIRAFLFSLILAASAAFAPALPAADTSMQRDARAAPIGAGDMAPDFTLEDQDGRRHALSAQRGRPVVLIFYRGHW